MKVPHARCLTHPPRASAAMTLLQGNDCVLDKVHLRYSNNAGILMVGSGHLVSDTLVESTDWLGSLAFPPLKIGFSRHLANNGELAFGRTANGVGVGTGMPEGVNNTVLRVSVRGFGNSGIVTSQLANQISYTHVWQGGLIGGDVRLLCITIVCPNCVHTPIFAQHRVS